MKKEGTITMSLVASVRRIFVPIHPEGYPFVGLFAVASLFLGWLWQPLFWVGVVLTLCLFFPRSATGHTATRGIGHLTG